MSERPIDINLTKSTETRIDQVPASERAAFRARAIQVLDRTMTVDRMHVKIPNDLSDYWCPNDPIWIAAAQLRGFEIDTEYGHKTGLNANDNATGATITGDVIYMTRPRWMLEEEQNIIAQQYKETHLTDRRKQKEEKDFAAQNEKIGMPPIISSTTEEVSGPRIEESLKN